MFASGTWLSFLPLDIRMQKGFTFLGHILRLNCEIGAIAARPGSCPRFVAWHGVCCGLNPSA